MAGLDINHYKASFVEKDEKKDSAILGMLNKDISFGKKKINDKYKEHFYLELSILLSAGVDIKASMELLEKQQVKKKNKILIETIKNKIISGFSLSQAMEETNQFTKYECMSLQIGEETGKITVILDELTNFFAQKIKQKQQIVKALSYPIIVLFTSFAAVLFMITFIIPMFSDIFRRFGGKLPYLTTVIINISIVVRQYSWLVIMIIISIIIIIRSFRKKKWFRHYSSLFLLKIPLAGDMMRQIYLSQMCSSFALLIGSKVPLLRALALVKQMIPFYPLYTSLTHVEKDILDGMPLHQSFSQFKMYDIRMITLLKVGEEVNELPQFFSKLSKQYNEEVEYKASILSSAIEPFIIIILGLIVAVILVAMYLPLFQLSTNIG